MLYNPPSGSTDPNAPYVGKNTSAGTQGSKVPPAAVEYTQREIVNAITAANIVPSNGDLTQLAQAIRAIASSVAGNFSSSAFWRYGSDTSTNAQVLVADVTPNLSAYDAHGGYRIVTANASTNGGTTANFDGQGSRNVVRADGTPIRRGDWTAGQVIVLLDDGTDLQLAGVSTSLLPSSGIVVMTSSQNWPVPAGVFLIKNVRLWSPGGGGGASTGSLGGGSGASGGGYAYLPSYAVTPGGIIVGIVGAPGQGGVGSDGTAGGTTSLAVQGQGAFLGATGGGQGHYGNNSLQTQYVDAPGQGFSSVASALLAGGGAGSYAIGFGQGSNGTTDPGGGQGGAGAFGGGPPTLNQHVGNGTPGNFPGGGGNGGCGGGNGGAGGGGLIVFEF